MDARHLVEELEAQIKLAKAMNNHRLHLAMFSDTHNVNQQCKELLDTLFDKLNCFNEISASNLMFALSKPDEKVAIVDKNRALISQAQIDLGDITQKVEKAHEAQDNKKFFEKLSSSNPYSKIEKFINAINNDPVVIEGFESNRKEMQVYVTARQMGAAKG